MLNYYQVGQTGLDSRRGNFNSTVLATSPLMYVNGDDTTSTLTNYGSIGGTLTLNNGQVDRYGVFANTNRSMDFNGTSTYVSTANSAPYRLTGSMSTLYLYNMDSFPSGVAVAMRVAGLGDASSANILWGIDIGLNGIGVFHEYGSGIDQQFSISSPRAGVGSHLLIVTRDSVAKIYTAYIDGAVVGTVGYTTNPDGGTSSIFNIGREPGTLGFYTDGRMESLGVWSRALSTTEMNTIYQSLL